MKLILVVYTLYNIQIIEDQVESIFIADEWEHISCIYCIKEKI